MTRAQYGRPTPSASAAAPARAQPSAVRSARGRGGPVPRAAAARGRRVRPSPRCRRRGVPRPPPQAPRPRGRVRCRAGRVPRSAAGRGRCRRARRARPPRGPGAAAGRGAWGSGGWAAGGTARRPGRRPRRGARPARALTGAARRGVRGGRPQRLGGHTALGSVRPEEAGGHADDPRPGTGEGGQPEVSGDLPEGLGREQGCRGDEGEDDVTGRADAGRVAHRLLHGGEQRADEHQDEGVARERGRHQGDGEPGEHAGRHQGEDAGPRGVRAAVRVEGAQAARHRVHREVEAAEGEQREIGRRDGGDDAQCRFEPDLGGAAQTQDGEEREPADPDRGEPGGPRGLALPGGPGRP